jgi:hypothetical protein
LTQQTSIIIQGEWSKSIDTNRQRKIKLTWREREWEAQEGRGTTVEETQRDLLEQVRATRRVVVRDVNCSRINMETTLQGVVRMRAG